ncbi:lytic murein transglycosylase [Candidatus Kaiserbacteria bacterium]|nr:lytic murein transglycosylase [Candidatus Kaiserbacteria bacterium]
MRPFLSVVVCALVAGALFVYLPAVYAQNPDLTPEQRAALEKQLAELEEEMKRTDATIAGLRTEGESLKRDIGILEGEIKKAKLKVRTTEIKIQQLSKGINIHAATIEELSEKIKSEQESLAQILRKTREIDNYSLVEAVFSSEDISKFFSDLDSFVSIKEALQASFEELRAAREETSGAKVALEGERTEAQILRSELVLAQKEVEQKEAQKRTLLKETQGQEGMYKGLKATQEKLAAEIRARLFPLRDAQGIPFGTAVQYAKTASAQTGVRAALILAILSQESDLGANVGQCLITDLATGDGKGKNTGTPFAGVMKVPRDTVPFERITKGVGRDWSNTPVSCPQPGGYGGAMGPTQFIPSTWELYEGRLASVLGVAATDPWNPSHAITATALYLTDVGAAGGTYSAEHTAAAKYNAGGNWATLGQVYANSVMGKAAQFQKDIDFLEAN